MKLDEKAFIRHRKAELPLLVTQSAKVVFCFQGKRSTTPVATCNLAERYSLCPLILPLYCSNVLCTDLGLRY